MRNEFSEKIKGLLAKRSGFLCSNPDCCVHTVGSEEENTGFASIGVAAHIHAASPGGPRYLKSMTAEERKSPDNGIWLCQNCARLIDSDEKRFPANLLREWKVQAEAKSSQNIGKPVDAAKTIQNIAPVVSISGPGAFQISGANAVQLGPNAINITQTVNPPQQTNTGWSRNRLADIIGQRRYGVNINPKPRIQGEYYCYVELLSNNDREFVVIINSRVIHLPFSMIEDFWNKTNFGDDYCLKLKCQITEKPIGGNLDN